MNSLVVLMLPHRNHQSESVTQWKGAFAFVRSHFPRVRNWSEAVLIV